MRYIHILGTFSKPNRRLNLLLAFCITLHSLFVAINIFAYIYYNYRYYLVTTSECQNYDRFRRQMKRKKQRKIWIESVILTQ